MLNLSLGYCLVQVHSDIIIPMKTNTSLSLIISLALALSGGTAFAADSQEVQAQTGTAEEQVAGAEVADQTDEVSTAGAETTSTAASTAITLFYKELGAFVSTAGETKEAFVYRVARFASSYTFQTNWEVCGRIHERNDGNGWAVNITTNGSQMACVEMTYEIDGYTASKDSIHTHPTSPSVLLSRQDIHLGANGICGDRRRVISHTFSRNDYAAGAGYLVAPRGGRKFRLMYQNGVGTAVNIGNLVADMSAPDQTVVGTLNMVAAVNPVASELRREVIQWGRGSCNLF